MGAAIRAYDVQPTTPMGIDTSSRCAHVGAAPRAYERPADENAPDRAVDCGDQPRLFGDPAGHRGLSRRRSSKSLIDRRIEDRRCGCARLRHDTCAFTRGSPGPLPSAASLATPIGRVAQRPRGRHPHHSRPRGRLGHRDGSSSRAHCGSVARCGRRPRRFDGTEYPCGVWRLVPTLLVSACAMEDGPSCTLIGCTSGASVLVGLFPETDAPRLTGATLDVCFNATCRSVVIQELPAMNAIAELRLDAEPRGSCRSGTIPSRGSRSSRASRATRSRCFGMGTSTG